MGHDERVEQRQGLRGAPNGPAATQIRAKPNSPKAGSGAFTGKLKNEVVKTKNRPLYDPFTINEVVNGARIFHAKLS